MLTAGLDRAGSSAGCFKRSCPGWCALCLAHHSSASSAPAPLQARPFFTLSSLPVSLSIPAPSMMTLLIIHGSLLQPGA